MAICFVGQNSIYFHGTVRDLQKHLKDLSNKYVDLEELFKSYLNQDVQPDIRDKSISEHFTKSSIAIYSSGV